MPWELEGCAAEADSAWVRCALRSSPATWRMYPFAFALTATCTLAGGSILLRYEAVAGRNGGKMPFAIGNHVSFRMPFTRAGRFEDCTIRTPATKRHFLSEMNLLSGKSERVDLRRPTPLARTEFLDAVLGGYRRGDAWFELADPASLTMRVSHAEQRAGGPFLAAERNILFVLWGSREHRYFCPEPWIGRPNALNSTDGRVALAPGARFAWEIRFTPIRH
jgi:galactose mutarotase-like enzyme